MDYNSPSPEGWRLPEFLSPGEVDCPGLRPLREHARLLSAILRCVFQYGSLPRELNAQAAEWIRVAQWLDMAGGLQHMAFDMDPDPEGSLYCGDAADHWAAVDTRHSWYATELTRLQYVWNALERMLIVLPLPSLPKGRGGQFARGTLLLRLSAIARPEHYGCVECHLRSHIRSDPDFAGIRDDIFQPNDVRGTNGTLMAVANRLRHYPAHGDVTIPEPEALDVERSNMPLAMHVPRLAARGLLLSVQMLLEAVGDALPQELEGPLIESDGTLLASSEAPAPVLDLVRDAHKLQHSAITPPRGTDRERGRGSPHTCHNIRRQDGAGSSAGRQG